jgi:Amt family ammonium transporter
MIVAARTNESRQPEEERMKLLTAIIQPGRLLVNGTWGTPAVGLFMGGGVQSCASHLVGAVAAGVATFLASRVIRVIINAARGIRLSRDEEIRGIWERGMGGLCRFRDLYGAMTPYPALAGLRLEDRFTPFPFSGLSGTV